VEDIPVGNQLGKTRLRWLGYLERWNETNLVKRVREKRLPGHIACLHDQNKSGFFGGPAFIQPIKSNLNFQSSDWLEKSRPSKEATFVLIMPTG